MHSRIGLVAAASSFLLATPAAAQGGPDGFGYTWEATPYDFVALEGGLGTPLGLSDDGEADVTLPFAFQFYGTSYSDLLVGSNGGLRFTTGAQVAYTNACLPQTSSSTVDVAVFWDDLNPTSAGDVFTWDDTANGRFVVSWEGVPHFSNVGAVSFQAHLYDTGEIQLHWDDVDFGDATYDNGASATVGIQDDVGGNSVALGYALEVSCGDPTVVDGTGISIACLSGDGDGDGIGCGDCDDDDDTIFPAAVEVCDGVDQNCDGVIDDGFTDGDGDGFMDCVDCDDTNDLSYPDAPELCDGLDNDCNGLDDFGDPGVDDVETDDDGDLLSECEGDCDDLDITVFPGTPEVCGDGLDNDCTGIVDDGVVTLAGTGGGSAIPESAIDTDLYFDAEATSSATIGDLDISVDITHSATADLELFLHSPIGTVVDLSVGNGGAGDNYVGTIFDDEAGTAITSGSPPYTGSYQPEGSLSDFDGETVAGTWTLQVFENEPINDDGELDDWSVTFTVEGTTDDDSDGWTPCEGDCEDSDDQINPSIADVCDGIDNDCDGTIDTGSTDADGDGFADCVDCDDTNDAVFPGAEEVCNGLDDDCNGLDDFGNPGVDDLETDDDGDGVTECEGDCDDDDLAVLPSAAEVCGDLVDNNCSGLADEAVIVLVGSGGGTPLPNGSEATVEVGAVSTFSPPVFDVDVTIDITHVWDGDLDILLQSPAGTAVELTSDNGGSNDDFTDTTFDDEAAVSIISGSAPYTGSFQPEGSLADFDLEAGDGTWLLVVTDDFPSADDGVLNSWSVALTFEGADDSDNDGSTVCDGDCDDDDDTVFPGNPESCDGADNDCDGVVDNGFVDGDGDASMDCVDCDDAEPTTYPGAPELCDGVDNDCDGLLDAGLPDVDGQETDDDGDGVTECDGDCDDDNDEALPGGLEVCDGADNDCDPGTDEATDEDGDGEAECDGDCDDAEPAASSSEAESCDLLDNDCDLSVDEDFDLDGDGSFAETDCSGLYSLTDCDDGDGDIFPGAIELCDGLDDNCNGQADEELLIADGDGAGTLISDTLSPQLFELEVVGPAFVVDVDVMIEFEHTWDSDLDIQLISPSGTIVELTTDNGGSGDDYLGTLFDDDAADPVTAGAAPFVGPFQPEGLLADFVGEDATGIWTLEVIDDVGADDGVLIGWQLRISYESDGDGVLACDDCDDLDPSTFPGGVEVCDGADNDCSGVADFGGIPELDGDGDLSFDCEDCDDADAANFPGNPELCDGQDNDCDPATDETVDADGDGVTVCAGDCDDTEPLTYPAAPERCDGLDNDCDSAANFGGLPELDLDEDGSFDCEDCDDEEPDVFPGNPELCDGLDNDCDPATDEAADSDGDGVTPCDGDCDDLDAAIFPGAPEVCDGEDGDCDGLLPADETDDADGDGFAACADCDDTRSEMNPDALEICDGLDNDCDPATDELVDNDGDLLSLCGGDCDDQDPTVFPGTPELCDGLDTDCNPLTDEDVDDDGDGLTACEGDCDDAQSTVNPDADEECDGLDTDCDGAPDADEVDDDGDGVLLCDDDCDDADPDSYPGAPELCDQLDNDCDGTTDDEEFDTDDDGYAPCDGDCDDTSDLSFPGAFEVCDGLDNDCDTVLPADEADADADGVPLCAGDCDDDDPAASPDGTEDDAALCADGIDNDCDGFVDEDDMDCDDDGDDDDSAGDDDDDATDDDDAADDDDSSAGTGGCDCEASLAGGSPAGMLVLLLLGLAGATRRRR